MFITQESSPELIKASNEIKDFHRRAYAAHNMTRMNLWGIIGNLTGKINDLKVGEIILPDNLVSRIESIHRGKDIDATISSGKTILSIMQYRNSIPHSHQIDARYIDQLIASIRAGMIELRKTYKL